MDLVWRAGGQRRSSSGGCGILLLASLPNHLEVIHDRSYNQTTLPSLPTRQSHNALFLTQVSVISAL